jgi:hypothetical protein
MAVVPPSKSKPKSKIMNHQKVRMRNIAILAGLFMPAFLSADGFSIRLDTAGFSGFYSNQGHGHPSQHVSGHSRYGHSGHSHHTYTSIPRYGSSHGHHHHHAPAVIYTRPTYQSCSPVYVAPVQCYTPPPVYRCPPPRRSVIYYRY